MGRKRRERNSEGKLVMVEDKKTEKREGKADIILAKAELSKAKAAKRRALVWLIGIGLLAYFVLSSGAGSGALNMIKQFLPGGE